MRSVQCLVLGLVALLCGPPCPHWALRIVVEPAVSLLSLSRRGLAHPVVLWWLVLSWGLPCGRAASRLVLPLFVLQCGLVVVLVSGCSECCDLGIRNE